MSIQPFPFNPNRRTRPYRRRDWNCRLWSRLALMLIVGLLPATLAHAQGGPAAIAKYGTVTVTPATLPTGGQIPFRSEDCDGDGDQDLQIAWSLPPQPVRIDFSSAFPGGLLPTEVTLEILTDNAVVRAFDDMGSEKDSATASPVFTAQTFTLQHLGGIKEVTIEGTQLCLAKLCWFRSGETQFIRGDANDDGGVDIADVVRILQFVFGGSPIGCLDTADVNDDQGVDISDAVTLIDALFVGSSVPSPPYPDCGLDPTADLLPCAPQPNCPGAGDLLTCFDSPTLGNSPEAIFLRAGTLEPQPGLDISGIIGSAAGPQVHFLIQAETLPLDRDSLESFEVYVLESVDQRAFLAVADVNVVSGLQTLPNVRWAGALDPTLKLARELQGGSVQADLPWAIAPNGDVALNITYHPDVDAQEATFEIGAAGGTVINEVPELRLCQVTISETLVRELAALEELQFLEPVLPPLEGANDNARSQANVEPLRAFPYDLTGTGITVAVYDEGNIDSNHPDFGPRVIDVEHPLNASNDHATHVAGVIGGSGVHSTTAGGSPGQFAGMAPAVDLTSHSYSKGPGDLFDNPGDLLSDIRHSDPIDLVNMSLAHNIGLNGFRCGQLGLYTATSRSIDRIVLGLPSVFSTADGCPCPAKPGLPFVLAAGNERQFGTPCGDLGTIGSPASSKNAIAVGALDATGAELSLTTSFGPTRDGRTKPDLVAPGCATSTDLDHGYTFRCGTSVASPVVAGVAALVLEEWRWLNVVDQLNEAPFAPHAVKAVLIHSATDLHLPGPDFTTGWGQVNAKAAVDLIRADFVASSAGNPLIYQNEAGAGDTFQAEFETDGISDQKFTLVWDDPVASSLAERTLVNDLDLRVVDPNGVVHRPWRPDPTAPNAPAAAGIDRLNNVEQITAPAVPGIWNVFVDLARNGSGSPQTFTLVRQPTEEIEACEEQVRKTIDFTPPWTGAGDRDFDGNGPLFDVGSFVDIRDGNEVWITLDVEAAETASDFTGAQGAQEHLVYYDPNVSSVSLLSIPFDVFNFPSTGQDPTHVFFGGGSLIRSLFFVGDTDGPEAGFRTRVRMTTNPIVLDCVPAGVPSQKQVLEVDPVFFLPSMIGGGDADFDGNGPGINVQVTLAVGGANGNQLIASVTMDALEVGGDGTHASGGQSFVVHTHPVPIASILSPTSSTAGYIDVDYHDDRPLTISGGLVREFVFVGDTDGPEAGTRTSVTVDFNPIRFMEQ